MPRSLNQGKSTKSIVQVLVVTAVGILLVGGGLIALMNATVTKLQSVADNKQGQVGSSEQVAERYTLTMAAYNDTISHLKYLETSVTPQAYLPTLLQQIQGLAQTTHLQVTSIRPSSPAQAASPKPASTDSSSGSTGTASKKAPPYDTISVSLEVNGTYPATAAFLYNLTRFPKIIAVTSASLHPNGGDPGSNPLGPPTIHSTLQLTAYVFHDDNAPAVIPGVTPPGSNTVAPAVATASSGAPTVSTAAAQVPANATAAGTRSILPATATAATFSAAAQHAIAGATGASAAAKERAEVGVGTL